MATFVLKEKKDETQREGETVTIGSRSSCSFPLSDPLVADEHCALVASPDGFYIEDLGSSMGTFVDGVATEGRTALVDGAQIVLGVTRLIVSIDAETPDKILLNIKGAFYYDDKKDALDWSRKEVAFGKFAPVRIGNWVAVFSMALVLVPITIIPRTSDALLEPGKTYHSGLGAFHHQLKDLPESDQDCSACHDSFSGAPATKCMTCHAGDIAEGHHPKDGSLVAESDSCVACHIDHRGTEAGALIARPATGTCGDCHDADQKVGADRALPDLVRQVALTYNTFSHADHFGKEMRPGRKLACGDCHQPYEEGTPEADRMTADGRRREFIPVDYEACLSCHADDPSIPAQRRYQPTWHGAEADAGAKCLQCHRELHGEDLKQAPAFAASAQRGFMLKPRSHADLVSKVEGPEACAVCHRNGRELGGAGPARPGVFEHHTHVVDAFATSPEDRERLSGSLDEPARGDCTWCHRDVAAADSLAAAPGRPHPMYSDQNCGECHTGDAKPSPIHGFAASGERVDFPHELHLAIEGGCYACHTFPAGEVAGLPVTSADVKDCTKCHTDHASIAAPPSMKGGTCQLCHKKGDPVYGNGSVAWARWSDTTFRHASRGHEDLFRSGDCVSCHGEATWKATTIDGVPIPTEGDAMCRECHVERKTRFHWR